MTEKKQSKNEGVDRFFEFWQQSQDHFFNAQKEAFEKFAKSFGDNNSNPFEMGMPEFAQSFQQMGESIASFWDPATMVKNAAKADTFFKGAEGFQRSMDPEQWNNTVPEQLTVILQSIADGPRFADLATPHIDMAQAWQEGIRYQQATSEFSKIMQETWGRAYERYSKDFTLEDLQSGDVDEALKSWLKIANEELLDTQHTQHFMDAQKKLIKAGTAIKARQRDMAESWCESYQMPSRTEVDDMAKIIHELRKEVRKLKRDVATLQENA